MRVPIGALAILNLEPCYSPTATKNPHRRANRALPATTNLRKGKLRCH